MATTKKSPKRDPKDRVKGKVAKREMALLEQLNKSKASSPAQLLGSDALAIKIRGVISTQCPSIDRAIGRGGYPLGRLILLHGKEGSGKTTLALHAIAETQKQGGMVIFADSEHKLDPDYAKALGVDLDQLVIAQPDYLQQFLEQVEGTIGIARHYRQQGDHFPVLIVLDSINALPTMEEFKASWEAYHIAPAASVWSSKLKKLMPLVHREDVALLFISQEREQVGVMFGRKERTGGGKALRYYSSLILEVTRVGAYKSEDGVVIGNDTQVKCSKNQIAPPFRTADFKILFGKGIDFESSLFQEAVLKKVFDKSGAWYSMAGNRLGQGQAKVIDLLRTDSELKAKVMEAIK